MDTTIKRKNIDLPISTLQKLSVMAVSKGKSLKAYIEGILISKADSISVEITDNPSPSGDKWFDDQKNIDSISKGISDAKNGKTKVYTTDDIKHVLGV